MSDQGTQASTGSARAAFSSTGPPVPLNAAFLLIAAGRITRERTEARLDELGIALRHVSVLGHLSRDPGLSYSELARRGGVTAQSMQATLRQLEREGAIERRVPSGQGRRAQLQLTDQGVELLRRARLEIEIVDRDLRELLGEQAHAALPDALLRVVSRVVPGPDDDPG